LKLKLQVRATLQKPHKIDLHLQTNTIPTKSF